MDRVILEFTCPTCSQVAGILRTRGTGLFVRLNKATGFVDHTGAVIKIWCLACHGPGFEHKLSSYLAPSYEEGSPQQGTSNYLLPGSKEGNLL